VLANGPRAASVTELDAINAPLVDAITQIARALHGRADARAVEAVTRAAVDLPMAAVRRHVRGDGSKAPAWLAGDIADASRTLLTGPLDR
jgi:hypothetical protein